MLDIQTSAVESAIGCHRTQHFTDWSDSAFARGIRVLHHQGRGAHADNHAVPPAVERQGGLFHHFVGSCCSAGQKACAHPFQQVIGSDVVRRDYDHSAAPPGPNPVFRHRDSLRGAGTCGVHVRVGAASTDELGELRMPHRKNFKQEAPIQDIRLFPVDAQVVDAVVDLLCYG